SGPSADPRANTVAHQVDDAIAILDHEGVDRVVVVGWSMGVQCAIELMRKHAARVAGIYAINGTSGRPFSTVLSSQLVSKAIPTLLRLIRAQAPLVGGVTRAVAGSETLYAAMKRFGMVAETADLAIFREV